MNVFLYGYRVRETKLDEPGPIKKGTKFFLKSRFETDVRRPVSGTLGAHIEGACLMKPDYADIPTMVEGIRKRFAADPPKPNRALRRRFMRFVEAEVKKLTPLPRDTDVSLEGWLAEANYPLWRKEEIRAEDDRWSSIWEHPSLTQCKSFGKDEFYTAVKHERGINARHDKFKAYSGPWFHALEKQLYKNPSFIKFVPVAMRPHYIREKIFRTGSMYLCTDFTAYESLFIEWLMKNCEFKLYRHMFQNIPGNGEFLQNLEKVLTGVNVCKYKWITVFLKATRMSGEMNTSLGNGFSNWMFLKFVTSEMGIETDIVVEGDDGLCRIPSHKRHLVPALEKMMTDLGLRVKMELNENIEQASFCGLVFDPEDLVNIPDPRKVLATFGMSSARDATSGRKKKMALLRAKAMSLQAQYPGCPIVQELAQYGLRVTRSFDVRRVLNARNTTWWERNQLKAAMSVPLEELLKPPPVPLTTRILMEQTYGVSVEAQEHIEQYLKSLLVVQPIRDQVVLAIMPEEWKQHYNDYVRGSAPLVGRLGVKNSWVRLDPNGASVPYRYLPVVICLS